MLRSFVSVCAVVFAAVDVAQKEQYGTVSKPHAHKESAAMLQHKLRAQTNMISAPPRTGEDKLHHILFIVSDDMRPEISPYGSDYVRTPHLQALSDDAFTFRRAYVQYALCSPSRTATLTGRRPDTSRSWVGDKNAYFRKTTGRDWKTLPQFFKEAGWRTIGMGKIYHEGAGSGIPEQDQEFFEWTAPYYQPGDSDIEGATFMNEGQSVGLINTECPGICRNPASLLASEQHWTEFSDGKLTMRAKEWIKNASSYKEPFFMAVGFHRPHIPYVYPKEFEYTGDVAFPPPNYHGTVDIPPYSPSDWTPEAMRYADLWRIQPSIEKSESEFQENTSSNCAVPHKEQRDMKRAYFSCIQYVDHLIGELTQALMDAGIYKQTTIVFWGDHGYKLGEHCSWFKHDNYEISARIPLLIKPAVKAPGTNPAQAQVLEQLVEQVDIYPTLVDLAGLQVPKVLEGKSLKDLIEKPTLPGNERVFWQYTRGIPSDHKKVMGYVMRTHNWRYTEWLEFPCDARKPMDTCPEAEHVAPRWDTLVGRELYHHAHGGAPSGREAFEHDNEDANLADQHDYQEIVAQLSQELQTHWPKAV